jgi:hypothetical protein
MIIAIDFDGNRTFTKNDDIYYKILLWKQNLEYIVSKILLMVKSI